MAGPTAGDRIAAKVVALLPKTGTVVLDATPTVRRCAAALGAHPDLVVATNGPDTFTTLREGGCCQLVLTGGRLHARSRALVGPVAVWTASRIEPDVLVTSSAAVDFEGTSEADLDIAHVTATMARTARRVIVAVESSVLGCHAVVRTMSWRRIDALVTELDPSDRLLVPYRRLTCVL